MPHTSRPHPARLTIAARRLWVQAVAALVTNSYFLAPYLKYLPCPTLNCYACPLAAFACPIGSLQHFVVIGVFPFLLAGFFMLIGAIIGRWSCGYLCPFGLFQDLLAKIKIKKYALPRHLSTGRYASLLILVLLLPAITGQPWFQSWWHQFYANAIVIAEPWFCKLCPAGTLEAGLPYVTAPLFRLSLPAQPSDTFGMLGWFFVIKVVILVAVIAGSVVYKRFFCRALCPLGAIWGLFNRISLLQLRYHHIATRRHIFYHKVCPVDIDIRKDPSSPDCIRCMQCVKFPGVKAEFIKTFEP